MLRFYFAVVKGALFPTWKLLNGKVIRPFIFIYLAFSSFGNDFCYPNLFVFSRVSEGTGKIECVSREHVWGGSLGFLWWFARFSSVSGRRENRLELLVLNTVVCL